MFTAVSYIKHIVRSRTTVDAYDRRERRLSKVNHKHISNINAISFYVILGITYYKNHGIIMKQPLDISQYKNKHEHLDIR